MRRKITCGTLFLRLLVKIKFTLRYISLAKELRSVSEKALRYVNGDTNSVESDFASLNGLLILGQSSARMPHDDDGPSKFNER